MTRRPSRASKGRRKARTWTWTTVTDDPATWPPEDAGDTLVETKYGDRMCLAGFQVRINCEDGRAVRWMPWPAAGGAP